MGIIYIMLKTFSAGLGIAIPVIIFWVLHMTKISHLCWIYLADSTPAFLIISSAYNIP